MKNKIVLFVLGMGVFVGMHGAVQKNSKGPLNVSNQAKKKAPSKAKTGMFAAVSNWMSKEDRVLVVDNYTGNSILISVNGVVEPTPIEPNSKDNRLKLSAPIKTLKVMKNCDTPNLLECDQKRVQNWVHAEVSGNHTRSLLDIGSYPNGNLSLTFKKGN